jgi:hypothetical protein
MSLGEQVIFISKQEGVFLTGMHDPVDMFHTANNVM